jgi:uncharacterized damage-inducible protein DinB
MIRSIADFLALWKAESENTGKVLGALTDASLAVSVTPDDRTIGRMAWHIAQTIPEMMGRTGLAVAGAPHDAPVPASAVAIALAYSKGAEALADAVAKQWTDATLAVEDDMYGHQWPRRQTLLALVLHEVHHRGQLTVVMRKAGLAVPGVYGPSREEWAQCGMPAPEI